MVSAEYLAKARRSVRRAADPVVDEEITDLIEECRADLQSLGVRKRKTTNEKDSLILGAVRCFVRWKFGIDNPDAEANREDYMQLRDELRRRRAYCSTRTTSH